MLVSYDYNKRYRTQESQKEILPRSNKVRTSKTHAILALSEGSSLLASPLHVHLCKNYVWTKPGVLLPTKQESESSKIGTPAWST